MKAFGKGGSSKPQPKAPIKMNKYNALYGDIKNVPDKATKKPIKRGKS